MTEREPYPVLISIPHCGEQVPPELEGRVALGVNDILDDIDPFTAEIYHIGPLARRVLRGELARSFVDLNRAPDDLPPANPDGVVKTVTIHEKPVYLPGMAPDNGLLDLLLERYYHPYHRALRENAADGSTELCLDCHSMAATGPPVGPDPGEPRPAICLGNARGAACDHNTTRRLARCLREAFSLPDDQVRINEPFAGGYITRTHGNSPLPWIQLEMSRALYLDSPRFKSGLRGKNVPRLQRLGERFEQALALFFGNRNR